MNMFAKPGESAQQNEPTAEQAAQVESQADAAAEPVAEVDESVIWTSRIPRFKFGRFQFDKGVLKLPAADSAELDKLLESANPRTKATISKVDASAAERVAKRYLESRTVRGVDTAGLGVNSVKQD